MLFVTAHNNTARKEGPAIVRDVGASSACCCCVPLLRRLAQNPAASNVGRRSDGSFSVGCIMVVARFGTPQRGLRRFCDRSSASEFGHRPRPRFRILGLSPQVFRTLETRHQDSACLLRVQQTSWPGHRGEGGVCHSSRSSLSSSVLSFLLLLPYVLLLCQGWNFGNRVEN